MSIRLFVHLKSANLGLQGFFLGLLSLGSPSESKSNNTE